MSEKISAGSDMPEFDLPLVGGGKAHIGGAREKYQLVVVYRGKHCPVCKRYLGGLNDLRQTYADVNAEIVVISGDPEDKAKADVDEFGWAFDVGYGLSQDQMRKLGLYISEPRSEKETDRPFPEPGVFVVNPEGKVQVVDISNAPWARPDLARLANGLKYLQDNEGYPIRGTLA